MTSPFWVVNTRIKLASMDNTSYEGMLDACQRIVREDGVMALWKGTTVSLMLVSNPAIQVLCPAPVLFSFAN